MSNQFEGSQAEVNQNRPEYMDRFEARRQRREERRGHGAWIGGLFLIGVGVVILLQNMGVFFYINNWWAFFILLPALGAFSAAWKTYQDAGNHWTNAARGSILGGLVLCLVASIFLFSLDWMILGPALLILAGAGIFLNSLLPG